MATSAQFWEAGHFGGESSPEYELLNARSPNRYHLMRLLRKVGMRNYGEILSTVLEDATAGQVPQSTASVAISQVSHVATPGGENVHGGVQTITNQEHVDLTINSDKDDASANTARAVTAADVTALQTELIPSGSRNQRFLATTDMVDLSGNGGGGKQASGR